jgi:hypothetical protein
MFATLVPPPPDGISTPYRIVAAGGRSRFVWSVCQLLGGLLAVTVPDEADQREVGHVVLRVVLLHRRSERRRGGEILFRRQRLLAEHERQVVGQRPRQRLPGLGGQRPGEVDPGDLGAERGVERGDRQRCGAHRRASCREPRSGASRVLSRRPVYSTRAAMTVSGGRSMVTLEFHDPSGLIAVKQPHAPRLETLAGKRVGFVSNEQWQAYRMLPRLKALLEADFPGIEVLPIDAFPQGNAVIGSEETAALVKASGVDAVIIGNAA